MDVYLLCAIWRDSWSGILGNSHSNWFELIADGKRIVYISNSDLYSIYIEYGFSLLIIYVA